MTDLDGLKKVNDTYGHLAGRMVVREMGGMLRRLLRENDVPALYGGDETIIIFPETPIDEATRVAEEIRLAFESRTFEFRGKTFNLSISQGLAEWPRHGQTGEEIISAADSALYAAKAAGRNCVRGQGD
jgi:diguanylate cyclase (GGDEF)-like protein